MEQKVQVNGGGVGLFGLMFLIFLTLKLTGVIAWSWWWVTLPLWGGLAVLLGIVALIMIATALVDKYAK